MDNTALFNMSYGMYIISSRDGGRHVGCVANSAIQVASSPATLAVSINKNNFTNQCISKTKSLALSILSEQAKESIIGTFGFNSSAEKNKFDNVPYVTTASGIAVLNEGVCGYITGKVIDQLDCFTHTVFIAEITDACNVAGGPPMTYAYYHKVIKGKAPKNAPTYAAEEEASAKTHVCSVCRYAYTGSEEEFKSLPDSFACPLCSAPKSAFS